MNFLFLEETTSGLAQTWPTLLMFGGLLLLLIVPSILNNKKRKQQMQMMMESLKVGVEIKTIGGMVGVVESLDDETGLAVINVGTPDAKTLITIDKSAIYPTQKTEPVVADDKQENS